jgi:hypothetical protein
VEGVRGGERLAANELACAFGTVSLSQQARLPLARSPILNVFWLLEASVTPCTHQMPVRGETIWRNRSASPRARKRVSSGVASAACGCFSPRSRSLTARSLRPASSASSSRVKRRAWRRLRTASPTPATLSIDAIPFAAILYAS